MYPVMEVFGHPVAMYGLCILAGMACGVLLAVYYGKKTKIIREDVLFASIYAAIGVLVGGKVLYLLVELPEITENWKLLMSAPENMVALFTGGFVFYGGLFGGVLGAALYCRSYQIPFRRLLLCLLPSIPLIHGFGRIGCLMAGCCYGIPYQGPGHLVFTHPVPGGAPSGIALFPVQLLEAGANLCICLILVLCMQRAPQLSRMLQVYLVLYAVSRFLLEFLRGDVERGFLLGLSTSQWISLMLLAGCAASAFWRHAGKRSKGNQGAGNRQSPR